MRLLPFVLPLAALAGLAAAPRSIYTPLAGPTCRTVSVHDESGATSQTCPGVAGYTLNVNDDDARMTVDVVAPGGATFPLDYWSVITTGFSSLGPRAEWRVEGTGRRTRPVALIVRVNASGDPEHPDRTTSYLAVARVSASGACVTERIAPSADMNARARRAADRAAGRPCLTTPGG